MLDPAVTVWDEGLTLKVKLGLSSGAVLVWAAAKQAISMSNARTFRKENAAEPLLTVYSSETTPGKRALELKFDPDCNSSTIVRATFLQA